MSRRGDGLTMLQSRGASSGVRSSYVKAKASLEACSRIDECKDWADRAEALASYAKQTQDDSLHKMAIRIQARAIQRCGELLKALQRPEHSGRPAKRGLS